MLYAGIDEAGYGPTLGPLCVSGAVLTTPGDPTGTPDLWALLRGAVCRDIRSASSGRLAVDDSKRLKRAGSFDLASFRRSIEHLERGVLAFASLAGAAPGTDEDLLVDLTRRAPASLEWYGAGALDLPIGGDAASLRLASGRLARVCEASGVRVRALRCVAMDERVFNTRLERTGSKGGVSLAVVGAMLGRVWALLAEPGGEREGLAAVDRQGGRTRYLAGLQRRLRGAEVKVVEESGERSVYEATGSGPDGPRRLRVEFRVEGERAHLPVALASMTAKLTRELLMRRFNAYWCGRISELKPTAGYATDARRWLNDAAPFMTSEEKRTLVRRA
ncbi:MAG TPA: hypothetical protein DEB06_08465 [Phycisphaerales bacterium]|nr:hypothetical protein [Phycisphaerales bacterium]